jgi:hypothetical protein
MASGIPQEVGRAHQMFQNMMQNMMAPMMNSAAGSLSGGGGSGGGGSASAQSPDAFMQMLQNDPIMSQMIQSFAGTAEGAEALEMLISSGGGQAALTNFMQAVSGQGGQSGEAQSAEQQNMAPPDELLSALEQSPEGAALLKGMAATPAGQQMLETLLTTPEGQETLMAMMSSLTGGSTSESGTSGSTESTSEEPEGAAPADETTSSEGADPAEFVEALAQDDVGKVILELLSKTENGGKLLEAMVSDPTGQAALGALVKGLSESASGEAANPDKIVGAVKNSELAKAFLGVLQEAGDEGKELVEQLVTTAQGQQGLVGFLKATQG